MKAWRAMTLFSSSARASSSSAFQKATVFSMLRADMKHRVAESTSPHSCNLPPSCSQRLGNSSLFPYVLRMARVSRQLLRSESATNSPRVELMTALTTLRYGLDFDSLSKYIACAFCQSSAPPQLLRMSASASWPFLKQHSTAASKFPTSRAFETASSAILPICVSVEPPDTSVEGSKSVAILLMESASNPRYWTSCSRALDSNMRLMKPQTCLSFSPLEFAILVSQKPL
mmetsp:Transcript_21842/g.45503  ORF Transcript_21842/g.45503 Transcript_21842/m.45503 type:complete len:230 (-) Transcript_21842:316-1005(-)